MEQCYGLVIEEKELTLLSVSFLIAAKIEGSKRQNDSHCRAVKAPPLFSCDTCTHQKGGALIAILWPPFCLLGFPPCWHRWPFCTEHCFPRGSIFFPLEASGQVLSAGLLLGMSWEVTPATFWFPGQDAEPCKMPAIFNMAGFGEMSILNRIWRGKHHFLQG